MAWVEVRFDVKTFEGFVGNGGDSGIEFLFLGKLVDYGKSIFVLNSCGICPRVVYGDIEVVLLESFDDVNDFGVAHIGTIFLEGEAEHEDVATKYLYAFFEHELDYTVGNICPHAVVHAASGEDNFRIVAVALGALGEIIGVNSDAMTANETRLEGKEIPLR